MCPFPPDGGAVERLDPGSEGAGTPGTAQDDSAAEIAEVLNASLAGVCATWRPSLANRAAADLVAAGFRRVPEDAASQVREFHVAFNLPIGDTTRTLNKLRADLIREEGNEAGDALESGDLEHIAKELADLVYVTYGAALTLGIDLDAAVTAVHRSNMSKLVDGKPVMRPDGKVLKGPNYQPPDMAACVLASVRGVSVSGGGEQP
jgi:NTP pyrophosphatase (non-canonical NTP hydrolase)